MNIGSEILEMLKQQHFSKAMELTPDDPKLFDMYWKDEKEEGFYLAQIYNKHKIIRHFLDTNDMPWNEEHVPYINLNLAIMLVLDKQPTVCGGKEQKEFCKVRIHCREIALTVLCVGKLKKDHRDISAIIARIVWGARGYCKIETEIIKIKRFRI